MNGHGTRLGAAMALLPLALAGCMATAETYAGMAPGTQRVDVNAHAFASAVDETEIQQGMLAQTKATNQAVRAFAARMVEEHSNALRTRETRMAQLGRGLGLRSDAWTGAAGTTTSGPVGSGSMGGGGSGMAMTPEGMSALHAALMANAASRPVAEAAPASLRHLQGLGGAEFDRGYMDAQVAAHQYALQNLDRMIASNRLGPEALGVMQAMRASVAAHLQTAQQLRAGL